MKVDELVWLRKLEKKLPAAIERALLKIPEERLLQAITDGNYMPGRLGEALRVALLADPPLTSVRSWAARLDVSPETLRYHWRRIQADYGLEAGLKDVLSVVLLWRAVRHKAGVTWNAVARKVGVHPTTLRRTARRLTGRSLSKLSGVSPNVLLRFFSTRSTLGRVFFGGLHDI